MTESRYKKDTEYGIYVLVNPLIKSICGNLSDSSVNYKRAEEFVLSNLKYHTFLNPIFADVSESYSNIIEKLLINSQTKKAEQLEMLRTKFLKMKLTNPKGVVDLNVGLLDLLLKLSTTPLDSSYMPPKVFEKVRESELILEEDDESIEKIEDYSDSESKSDEKSGSESESNLDSSAEEADNKPPVPALAENALSKIHR